VYIVSEFVTVYISFKYFYAVLYLIKSCTTRTDFNIFPPTYNPVIVSLSFEQLFNVEC